MHQIQRKLAVLLAVCLLLVPAGASAADPEPEGKVVFEASELNAENEFFVTMSVYDATFNAFQFALRYDPKEVQPISADEGKAAEDFNQFAVISPASRWMSQIGTGLDTKAGYFKFSGYVSPGSSGSGGVNDEGSMVAGEKGVQAFIFHFKKIGNGDVKFWIATEEGGDPYDVSLPSGAALVDAGRHIETTVQFVYPQTVGKSEETTLEGTSSNPVDREKPAASMTREERLKDTVILQIGNAKAAVEGKMSDIYANEPGVTAYAHDNRTFVPVRFVAENLGAEVDWSNETQTVTLKKDNHTVSMTVGSDTYTVDGVNQKMDAPAEFKQDSSADNARTMVPIRFVAEALDRDVQWDQTTNAVIIAPKSTPWDLKGAMEKEILSETLLMLSPMVQSLIN